MNGDGPLWCKWKWGYGATFFLFHYILQKDGYTGKHKWKVKFLPFSNIQRLLNSILSFYIVNQSVRLHFMIAGPKPNYSNWGFQDPKIQITLSQIFYSNYKFFSKFLIQNQTLQCLCITDTHLNPIAFAFSSSCGSKVRAMTPHPSSFPHYLTLHFLHHDINLRLWIGGKASNSN